MRTARPPTIRQQKFAAGIAAGQPKTVAYRGSHPGTALNAQSLRKKASLAAKSPAVQAEITRLMRDPVILQFCPDAQDPDKIEAHAVAVMAKLSESSDEAIAAHAAMWLADFAGALRQRLAAAANRSPEPTDAQEQSRLIQNLRGLYAKAITAPPLELAVEPETAPEPASDPAEPSQASQHHPAPANRS